MRLLKNLLLFQKPHFFLAYAIAIALGLLFGGEPATIGWCFLFTAPKMQFFFYDLKDKQQYYYYYNLGLSKRTLWGSTIGICLINLVILSIL
ncbi:hypothetical protein [Mangrovimonas xylaniphaga]|uniref:hypothetical protein n=1 Tax=Mangrovimonas xylaniphaga TaxID=1645915 RepID=UPI0012F7F79A|nr:hypothetical protein [Mangrovimonas xylaniphaga]